MAEMPEETPEGSLKEALRLEQLSQTEARSGNFQGAAFFRRESDWWLNYAAKLEGSLCPQDTCEEECEVGECVCD